MPRPTKRELPLAVVDRMLRARGATRVGKDALDGCTLAIENYLDIVLPLAIKNSHFRGRKTIKVDDFKHAIETLNQTRTIGK